MPDPCIPSPVCSSIFIDLCSINFLSICEKVNYCCLTFHVDLFHADRSFNLYLIILFEIDYFRDNEYEYYNIVYIQCIYVYLYVIYILLWSFVPTVKRKFMLHNEFKLYFSSFKYICLNGAHKLFVTILYMYDQRFYHITNLNSRRRN